MGFVLNRNFLRNSQRLRRRFLLPEPAKYEGYWGSICRRNLPEPSKGDLLTSLAKIYYSKSTKSWIHHGFEFDDKGSCIGEFRVESLHFSKKRGLWFFEGTTWKHEAGTNELYSERYEAKNQLSFISLAPKMKDHIVSRYLDDPISAGKWPQASGRAAMTRVSNEQMVDWYGDFQGVIEHPIIRSSMPGKINDVQGYLLAKIAATNALEEQFPL